LAQQKLTPQIQAETSGQQGALNLLDHNFSGQNAHELAG